MKINRILTGAALFAILIFLFLRMAGRFLVVDAPERSDAIVVLAGDVDDKRYQKGLELLNAGMGKSLLVDARTNFIEFGRTEADLEAEYIRHTAGRLVDRTHVCGISADSTDEETASVDQCLKRLKSESVLLVTSDFHTRRAFTIFRRRLPHYRWSVAAARDDAVFGVDWWRRREWAKTFLLEWTKLIWWISVDQWRGRPCVS